MPTYSGAIKSGNTIWVVVEISALGYLDYSKLVDGRKMFTDPTNNIKHVIL